jgi:hypothetical protein
MTLRSASLPGYQARLVDLSQAGARLQLKGAAGAALVDTMIRFGVSPFGQAGAHFEGLARVAWTRHTQHGCEVGLEWERLSASNWSLVNRMVDAACSIVKA